MTEEKSLEELNTDLESAISEHGDDSDEAKAIQASIDQLEEKDKKFDYSYVRELREEAKKYRTDNAKLKAEFAKVQEELKKIENEKLSDSEKKEKKILELEKSLVDIQTEYKDKEIDNLILTVASGKNFADLEVVKLLTKKELDSEEDVDSKTVEKIVEKIAKDKPYLLKGKSSTPGSGNFSKRDMEGGKDPDVLFGEMIKKKL
ncbi:MAG: hypothetical protein ACTSQE_16800 [Candidatus Heimdallarchaeaceae archaeon]